MSTPPPSPAGPRAPRSRIDRLVARARWIIAFERLWPGLVLAAGLGAAFVALAWLGVWAAVPRPARIAGGLALAGGLLVVAVATARRLAVSRADALRRLDRDAGTEHRPVSALEDRLANAGADPVTRALWDLSRRRLDAALAAVRLRPPSPRLVDRDPYALRAVALLGLVAAGFVAGEARGGRLAAALDWRGSAEAGPALRVDAWIDPPGYTGKPPVVLASGEGARLPDRSVSVPVRSVVVVRSTGGAPEVSATGGLHPVARPAAAEAGATAPSPGESRFTLDGDGRLILGTGGGASAAVALTAIPDRPPTVVLEEGGRPAAPGSLTLSYRIDDDYGVAGADARFDDPVFDGRSPVRALVPAPRLALALPPAPGGLGHGQTAADLSDHPWAGATVNVVLSARDEGGNVGMSAPVRIRLPARRFNNPLARALVEQRRDLNFDPDHRDGIATALDALMIGPDQFGTSKAVYLGLYTARQRLAAARRDEDLVGLSDFLWDMAVRIEEGDASAAARDLRAAAQALRDALARDASPDEIARLTEALRRQMDAFLSEMARNADAARDAEPDPNARAVTSQDLAAMLDRMQQMARNGDRMGAQAMLDRLQSMLNNLQSARKGDPARRAMREGMSELDKLTRRQQAVRDRTFRRGDAGKEGDRDPSGQPQADGQQESGEPQADDLQGQQGDLRQQLQELQRRMRQLGLKGEKGLDDAEGAMKEAEQALGEGRDGNKRATDAQGRALQGLQAGAGGLAKQMAQGRGEGSGEGEGDGRDGPSIGMDGSENGSDPLGRPRDGRGTLETRGPALDESVAARAQRVLQELRRRLGDPSRPKAETDYLERLLGPY